MLSFVASQAKRAKCLTGVYDATKLYNKILNSERLSLQLRHSRHGIPRMFGSP
jgi:hypothetical protein